MKKHFYWIAILCIIAACSKPKDIEENGGINGPGNAFAQLGAGIIYYNWATEGGLKVDLKTGVKSQFLQYTTRRNGWDVSRDNTIVIQSADHPDDYDAELYTITNIKDGTIVSQFKKYTGYANHTSPTLSYDKKLILAAPTYDDGIIVLDMQGNIIVNLVSFGGQKLSEQVEWMPDNTVLFRQGNSLYRTNKEFTKASLVKTFNFASWGDFAVSPDGSKIALNASSHIWMMNVDGSNLTQITDSKWVDVAPVFSPDSKYLLVGYDFTKTNQWGRYWYMAIIPADFQKYDLEEGADKRVTRVIPKGETRAEACDGEMYWR